MEYKPFEPFKALNSGEKVYATGQKDTLYEVVALHETYFFGKNKPGWEWDIAYEVLNLNNGKISYWTSRFLWTLDDEEVIKTWTSEDWSKWLDSDPDYIYCK